MTSPDDSNRLKSLLVDALERGGAERAAFLDERCAGDPDLRARVEGLLRAHDGAPDFLREGAAATSSGEAAGTVIGRYKLLQQIGEGGFGTVWMAEQLEPVRRKVALKIIKLGMDTKQVVARFEAERQALALMDHPNIAKVLDGGVTGGGRPFFVMELVRGVPITRYCDEARLPTRERLELFVQVCHAVHHAHQKSIIHRDIKPSNVMVTLHDGRPVPMVIDFGIAKATSGTLTEKTLFTEFRQFLGTPEYMSPEQAEISGLDVDTRSDIYSLGVLLYELLTGTTPVDGKTLRSAAYEEILRLIREVEPQRPSNRVSTLGERRLVVAEARGTEPGALQRLVRGDLDWIVMKAIEKERTRRYESATSFAQDLERYLANEPIEARPPSRAYQLRKFVRRNRVAVGAGAFVVLALVAGTTAATIGFLRAERGRRDALAAEVRAEHSAEEAQDARERALEEARNARLAEGRERAERQRAAEEAAAAVAINAFYDEMLLAIDPMRLRQRSAFAAGDGLTLATAPGLDRDVSVEEMLRGAAAAVDASFGDKPALAAKVRETIGVTLLGLGHHEDALAQLELASALLDESGADEADRLRLTVLQGHAATEDGDFERAVPLLREAREGLCRVHGLESPAALHATMLLARALMWGGEYDEAHTLLVGTLAVQRRDLGEHRDTVDTLNHLADVYFWQTKSLQAERYVSEAYEIATRILDSNDIVRVEAEYSFGVLLEFEMEYERAEPLLRDALARKRRLLGSQHPSTAYSAYHLARALQDRADLPERERLLGEAIATLEAHRAESPSLGVIRRDLAMLLFRLGKTDEAVALAQEYARRTVETEGPTDPRSHEAVDFLRNALSRAGREAEAEQAYRDMVELRTTTFGADDLGTCSALGDLCRFLLGCGKLEEAREAWQGCLDLRQRIALRPGASAEPHRFYGEMLLDPLIPDMRDPEGAIEYLQRALDMGLPPSTSAWRDLTRAYLLAGRPEEALAAAEMDLERSAELADSGSAAMLVAHAELLLDCAVEELRDPAAALPYLRRAVVQDEENARGWSLLAHLSEQLGDEEGARGALAAEIELYRGLVLKSTAGEMEINSYLWSMVRSRFDELRPRDALAETTGRLAELIPGDETIINTLGVARYRLGQAEEAARVLEHADRIHTGNRAYNLLPWALCLHELGQHERARELLEASRPLLDDPKLSYTERRELWSLLQEAEASIGQSQD